jgi:enamine deaminase RidA (YjgF/YER057c/UK114 family)
MEKLTYNPSTLPPAAGYSQIVQVSGGATVYIAGQVAWDVEGNLVGAGDFEAQARQVFTNLVAALAVVRAQPSDLVRIGIYVVDHGPEKLRVIRSVRDEILQAEPPPASTLIGVQSLALPDLLIEVDAIAVV